MTFLEALEEAKKGKKVRHNLWSSEMYLEIKNYVWRKTLYSI